MTHTSTTLRSLSNDVRALADAASSTTVALSGARQRPTTGTIVGPEQVIAVHHVIASHALAVHTHDGRTLDATVVGRDDTRDLALLSVPSLDGKPLPRASAPAQPGDLVLGVSRNWRREPVASLGVIGAVGGPLRIGAHGVLERVLRADIHSSRGISGGSLVNASGELVGIVNAGLARGVPLAVPAEEADKSMRALLAHGRIRRGFLGVGLQPVALPARQHPALRGLLVVGLEAEGPADTAGLLVGDVIVAAGSQPASTLDELQALLTEEQIGRAVSLSIVRGGAEVRVDVTVGERAKL